MNKVVALLLIVLAPIPFGISYLIHIMVYREGEANLDNWIKAIESHD